MTDATTLYRDVVLAHSRAPHNRRRLANADRVAPGHNPLCGDALEIAVTLDGIRITDAAFDGRACAIAVASASMMTDAVRDRSVPEALALADRFGQIVDGVEIDDAGDLAVFAAVRRFPARKRCATLGWEALRTALTPMGDDECS